MLFLLVTGCFVYDESLLCGEDCMGSRITPGEPGGEGRSLGSGGSFVTNDLVSATGRQDSTGIGGMAGADSSVSDTSQAEDPCLTHPISSRGTWTARASTPPVEDNLASQAIDADLSTRWTTGSPMAPGDWWQLDFGRTVAISDIEVYHSPNDHPRGYEIVLSDKAPTPMTPADWEGENDSGTLLLTFDTPALGRYLQIRQTGESSNWWSVTEIFFRCTY